MRVTIKEAREIDSSARAAILKLRKRHEVGGVLDSAAFNKELVLVANPRIHWRPDPDLPEDRQYAEVL